MPDGDSKARLARLDAARASAPAPAAPAPAAASWLETLTPPAAPKRRVGERTVMLAADAQGRVRMTDVSWASRLRALYWGARIAILVGSVAAVALWHDDILRYVGQQMGRNAVPLTTGMAQGAARGATESTQKAARDAWDGTQRTAREAWDTTQRTARDATDAVRRWSGL